MQSPLVSVLMTAFNRELYISEAIESVLCSSFQDFELIIVDDCSKDRTLQIARSYESKDERIKVYSNSLNLGDYLNRNKAANYAKGKYLKYLDADDTIYPHGLEVMVRSMEKYSKAALGIQCNKREDLIPYPIELDPHSSYGEHYLKGGLFLTGPTGAIINRAIFNLEGGFSGKRYIGDTELWLNLASKYPVVKFQPSLIWWRTHTDQEINKEKKSFAPVLSRYKLDKQIIFSNNCPFNSTEKERAFKKLNRRFILNTVIQVLFKGNKISTVRFFFKAKLSLNNILFAIFHK